VTARTRGWRDRAAAELAAAALATREETVGDVLVVGDRTGVLARALGDRGAAVHRWGRRLGEGEVVSAWPPDGTVVLSAVRLPRSRAELAFAVHAAAARTRPGGTIAVYGANDEGIRSADRALAAVAENVTTLRVGGHCRVVAGRRSEAHADGGPDVFAIDFELSADDWGSQRLRGCGGRYRTWPGVFGGAGLDAGTRALVRVMAGFDRSPERVLDFGCGWGPLARAARALWPDARVEALDVDALAVRAVAANAPGVEARLGDRVEGAACYDLIVANPPYHDGKEEDTRVIEALFSDGAGALREGGCMVLVVQRRLPVPRLAAARFRRARPLADEGIYRVWELVGPL